MVALRALLIVCPLSFFVSVPFAQVELQVLRSSDGAPGDQFGFSLDTDGVHLLVGAASPDPPRAPC